MSAKGLWLSFRYTRWLLWLGWLVYCAEFVLNRQNHMNPFGQLRLSTEFWMFTLPLMAVTVGCFELMIREKAGITRSNSKVGIDR